MPQNSRPFPVPPRKGFKTWGDNQRNSSATVIECREGAVHQRQNNRRGFRAALQSGQHLRETETKDCSAYGHLTSWGSHNGFEVGPHSHSWSHDQPAVPGGEPLHSGPHPLSVRVSLSPQSGPSSPSSYQPPSPSSYLPPSPAATTPPDAILLSPSVQLALKSGCWLPRPPLPVQPPVTTTSPPLPPGDIQGRSQWRHDSRPVRGPEWLGGADTHGRADVAQDVLRDRPPCFTDHATTCSRAASSGDHLSKQAWYPLTSAPAVNAEHRVGDSSASLSSKRTYSSDPAGQDNQSVVMTAAGKPRSQGTGLTLAHKSKVKIHSNKPKALFPVSLKQKLTKANIENEPPLSASTPKGSPSWRPSKRSKLPDILSEVPTETPSNTRSGLTCIADNYSEEKSTTDYQTSTRSSDCLSDHYHGLSIVTPEKYRHRGHSQEFTHCNCSVDSVDLPRCEEPHDHSHPTCMMDLTSDSVEAEMSQSPSFIGPVLPEGLSLPGVQVLMPRNLLIGARLGMRYSSWPTGDSDDGDQYQPGQMSPSMQAVSEYEKQVSACYCPPSQSVVEAAYSHRSEPGPQQSAYTHQSEPGPQQSAYTHQSVPGPQQSAYTHQSVPGPQQSAYTHQSEPGPQQSAYTHQSVPGPQQSAYPSLSASLHQGLVLKKPHVEPLLVEPAHAPHVEPIVFQPNQDVLDAPQQMLDSRSAVGLQFEPSSSMSRVGSRKSTSDSPTHPAPLLVEEAALQHPVPMVTNQTQFQKPSSNSKPAMDTTTRPAPASKLYDKRRMLMAESMGVAGILKRIRNSEDSWNGFPAATAKPSPNPPRPAHGGSNKAVATAQRDVDWFEGVPDNWERQKRSQNSTSFSKPQCGRSALVSPLSRPGSGCGSSASDAMRMELVSPYRNLCFTPEARDSPCAGPQYIYSHDKSQPSPDSSTLPSEGLSNVTWNWKTHFQRCYGNLTTPYIDTHCHLDFLFQRSGFKGGTFRKFREENVETFPSVFEGCVAIFCNPHSFKSEGLWSRLLEEDGIWGAVGCHPKCVSDYTESREKAMRRMLQHPGMVALGEIGLDYSGSFHEQAERQQLVFRRQLQMALDTSKPLVIHCRDAEEDCIKILEEIIPRNYRIHRHCFTGDWPQAQIWLTKFPNSYIGLTPIVTFRNARGFGPREVAKYVPLDRLLLETDAPYFVPWKIPRSDGGMVHSHPGMAVAVAAEVAHLRGVPISRVLEACRQNTRHMYGI